MLATRCFRQRSPVSIHLILPDSFQKQTSFSHRPRDSRPPSNRHDGDISATGPISTSSPAGKQVWRSALAGVRCGTVRQSTGLAAASGIWALNFLGRPGGSQSQFRGHQWFRRQDRFAGQGAATVASACLPTGWSDKQAQELDELASNRAQAQSALGFRRRVSHRSLAHPSMHGRHAPLPQVAGWSRQA